MRKDWLLVMFAACFEVGWVVGLKHASSFIEWTLTGAAIILSFILLIRSGERLPVGTVYAVFAGLGTAGTVIVDIVVFSQPFRWSVIALISLLLVGVIGLKMVTERDA
ncbi:DMT family transporter [Halalkalibacter urbisdiaboli]|uniref:DMT family transporter n=1 Tax=Halalkalibacter urbisdiaboli TaxID=1960589 RepID=UPI000B4517FB|nr:multidrug efflux SMR transporter [Halalkalibacter urbisdiaboli]